MPVPDKRVTIDDIVAEVRDGMTVGIGGWGSWRKPMAVVRALVRSPVKDLTIVTYGGPDVGLLCRAGKVRRVVYSFVSLDSIPLEPHFRAARQSGTVTTTELDEGMFLTRLASRGLAGAVPADPGRPRLRRHAAEPAPRDDPLALRRRRGARGNARARARRRPHSHASRRSRWHRTVPRCRSLLRRSLLHGRPASLHVGGEDRRHRRVPTPRTAAVGAHQPADDRRHGRDAARRGISPSVYPTTRATRSSSATTR